MKKYIIAVYFVVISIIIGCSSSNQNINRNPYQTTENEKFRPSIISRNITYQYADTGNVAGWDTTNHLPQANTTSPAVINKITPEFPEIAKHAVIEGKVLVKVHVGKDGAPIKVISLLVGVELFEKPVHDAVMKWKFIPPIKNDQPQEFWAVLEFNFVFINGVPTVIVPN